jgi:hypothetical protein
MNVSIALSSRLFVLLFLPFQAPTTNSVYLSLGLILASLVLCFGVNREGFSSVHHHLKHPETFSLALILSSVLAGVDHYLLFALGLSLLVVVIYFSSKQENERNKKILGLRYDLYDRWVSDFLPGIFPVAQLPKFSHFSFRERIRRVDSTLYATIFLVLIFNILSIYRPFHSHIFMSFMLIASLLLFLVRFPPKVWQQVFRGKLLN